MEPGSLRDKMAQAMLILSKVDLENRLRVEPKEPFFKRLPMLEAKKQMNRAFKASVEAHLQGKGAAAIKKRRRRSKK